MLLTGISALIVRRKMRKRIERATRIKVKNESQLTSLTTWMAVGDKEDERSPGRKS